MYLLITCLFLLITNTSIYSYAVISNKLGFEGWKIFLIPLILFPLIYIANLAFSGAFIFGPKGNMTVAGVGIINIAIWILVVMTGDFFYYKNPLDPKMILGAILVTMGAALITFKS